MAELLFEDVDHFGKGKESFKQPSGSGFARFVARRQSDGHCGARERNFNVPSYVFENTRRANF